MTVYQQRGKIPQKKHTAFYQNQEEPGKKTLFYEELVSTKGFDGIFSTKYHLRTPPQTLAIDELPPNPPPVWENAPLMCSHFRTGQLEKTGSVLSGRSELLFNSNVVISTADITENTDIFYKNAHAHELVFFHHGNGWFFSEYGTLEIREGDYLVIPKGTIYRFRFGDRGNTKLLVLESTAPFEIPRKYRNEYGQLLEHAPYSERDFHCPKNTEPVDETGEFPIIIKAGSRMFTYTVPHHPFDLVGWDGYLYPYTFNIKDFCPIVGKLHQPPPVHLVFTTQHFVICNFTPRLFDFHPDAIPAPYFHSNLDSDEVIYYVSGNFMSRKGIEEGSITLHPMGVPHGPQPGKIEASIGKKGTNEYAVMIDTFAPLTPTTHARDCRQENYFRSWLEK